MNNYNTIKCDSSEIGLARKFKTQTSDATNDFRIMSIELEDGEPKVEWEPKTNRWKGRGRRCRRAAIRRSGSSRWLWRGRSLCSASLPSPSTMVF